MPAPTLALLLSVIQAPHPSLTQGREALARFDIEAAVTKLEAAALEGGYDYEENVSLWESLGIARAYAERRQDAEAAFVHLLAMAPTHALSYTLSPKATFPYEAARKQVERQSMAVVEYVWPRGQLAGDPLPVTIDVRRDRLGLMDTVTLCAARGNAAMTCGVAAAIREGAPVTTTIAAPADTPSATETVAMMVVLRDAQGNVVQRSNDAANPRLVQLPARESKAWYQRWYTWAAAAGVVAITTGLIVHAQSDGPSTTPATFDWQR